FSYFLDVPNSGALNPKKFTDKTLQECANHISKLGNYVWNSRNSPYNTYQDCYSDKKNPAPVMRSKSSKSYENYENDFYDQGANQFADSTDAMGGFQCYSDNATEKYLNLPEVRKSLHIKSDANKWVDCRNIPYVQNEWDMSEVFY
ncbi:hypothetical protein PFISCL1PPCAC_28610, partial [Pristionchus fissidentatus]